jgi:hypothetical protein
MVKDFNTFINETRNDQFRSFTVDTTSVKWERIRGNEWYHELLKAGADVWIDESTTEFELDMPEKSHVLIRVTLDARLCKYENNNFLQVLINHHNSEIIKIDLMIEPGELPETFELVLYGSRASSPGGNRKRRRVVERYSTYLENNDIHKSWWYLWSQFVKDRQHFRENNIEIKDSYTEEEKVNAMIDHQVDKTMDGLW